MRAAAAAWAGGWRERFRADRGAAARAAVHASRVTILAWFGVSAG
jgi:hypothetical protein